MERQRIYPTQIWVSIAIVFVRRRAFEKRFSDIVKQQHRQRKLKASLNLRRLSSVSFPRPFANNTLDLLRSRSSRTDPKRDHDSRDPERNLAVIAPIGAEDVLQKENSSNDGSQAGQQQGEQEQGRHQDDSAPNQITFAEDVQDGSPTAYQQNLSPPYVNVRNQAESNQGHNSEVHDHYFQLLDMFGRNSSFHHLSEVERRRLGGVEYRAVCLLSVIVPLYLFLLAISRCLRCWRLCSPKSRCFDETKWTQSLVRLITSDIDLLIN